MMVIDVIRLVLQAVPVLLGVLGLLWGYQRRQNSRFDRLHADINAIENRHKDDLSKMSERRRVAIGELRGRVDALEISVVKELNQRLANIEGEMKAQRNLLQTIQQWFVNNTPKG